MSTDTLSLHSPQWFDDCFAGAKNLPADIRAFSEAVCKTFHIRGICDPLYIANSAAMKLGRGDGRSSFFEGGLDEENFAQARLELVQQLSFAYATCIDDRLSELSALVSQHLKRR